MMLSLLGGRWCAGLCSALGGHGVFVALTILVTNWWRSANDRMVRAERRVGGATRAGDPDRATGADCAGNGRGGGRSETGASCCPGSPEVRRTDDEKFLAGIEPAISRFRVWRDSLYTTGTDTWHGPPHRTPPKFSPLRIPRNTHTAPLAHHHRPRFHAPPTRTRRKRSHTIPHLPYKTAAFPQSGLGCSQPSTAADRTRTMACAVHCVTGSPMEHITELYCGSTLLNPQY